MAELQAQIAASRHEMTRLCDIVSAQQVEIEHTRMNLAAYNTTPRPARTAGEWVMREFRERTFVSGLLAVVDHTSWCHLIPNTEVHLEWLLAQYMCPNQGNLFEIPSEGNFGDVDTFSLRRLSHLVKATDGVR